MNIGFGMYCCTEICCDVYKWVSVSIEKLHIYSLKVKTYPSDAIINGKNKLLIGNYSFAIFVRKHI